MKKNSILFVCPDYHSSFILRDELRRNGWRADIYVPFWYPKQSLFDRGDYDLSKYYRKGMKWFLYFSVFPLFFLFLFRYKHFYFYGLLESFNLPFEEKINRKNGVRILLEVLKIFNKTILYMPSGCHDEELQSGFQKFDDGNICGNCGVEICNDEILIPRFKVKKKYSTIVIGNSCFNSSQLSAQTLHFKYKCLDLEKWNPNVVIPEKFIIPKTAQFRIMHAFVSNSRSFNNKNIKGTPFIHQAIDRLKNDGYDVELFYVNNVKSTEMRFYQLQADIVIDQLIYGWWGSMTIECLALGKPVILYLIKEWKKFFFNVFPEYKNQLPIVESNTHTIYAVLKDLLDNPEKIKETGEQSRIFAEQHLDVKKNAQKYIEILNR
ncbi:MAG: wbmO [Ignavibacteria bacterium]|nr:wbmO [Ignavibacteria bacterium]